jgi:L-threonylcarbamoyladenylate synthase
LRAVDGTVAVRASPHAGVVAIIQAWQAPITSTSANAPGEPPSRDAREVANALERLRARDVLVLDGGRLPPSEPSTLVAVAEGRVRVLREGALSRHRLEERLRSSGIHVE